MVKERKLQYGNKNSEIMGSPRSIATLPSITSRANADDSSDISKTTKSMVTKIKLPIPSSPSRPQSPKGKVSRVFTPKPRQTDDDKRYELHNTMDHDLEEKIHKEIRKREGTDLFMDVVLEKLYHVSINKFGGIKKLMKMFKKNKDDLISYEELTSKFEKHGLYDDFSEVEVDLIYDRLMDYDPKIPIHHHHHHPGHHLDHHHNHSGHHHLLNNDSPFKSDEVDSVMSTPLSVADAGDGIHVDKLIEQVQQVEMKDNDLNRYQKQLASFLMNEVGKRRNQLLTNQARGENLPSKSPFFTENSKKESLKPMKLSLKEIDETIDDVLKTTSAVAIDDVERTRNKYARYIRLTNTKLDMIPFYHMRQKELELLHKNDANLKNLLSDADMIQRRDELRAKLISNAAASECHDMKATTTTSTIAKEAHAILPTASNTTHRDHDGDISSDNLTRSSLFETMRSVDDFQPMLTKSYHPLKEQIESGSGIFNHHHTPHHAPHHVPRHMSNTSSSSSKHDYQQPSYRSINGKRYYDQSHSDYERMGMSMGYVDKQVETNDRIQSASADYFSPLLYAPSQPVARVSTTSMASTSTRHDRQKRELQQLAKYHRQIQHQQHMDDRLEYESITQKISELKRCEFRNAKMIAYKSNVLLDDMQSYKKSSNSLLAKRPNFSQAEKMLWNSQILPIGVDDRDFRSTTKISF